MKMRNILALAVAMLLGIFWTAAQYKPLSQKNKNNGFLWESIGYMVSGSGSVSEYVSSKLPSFDKFVSYKLKDLTMPDAQQVKAAIESDIAEWQKKGEFESTAKWQTRVNETTRQARVDSLTKVHNAEMARIKTEYDSKLPAIKAEYESLRQKYAKEFYAQKEDLQRKRYALATMELMPYDADNETFLISSSIVGDILLPVSVDNAPTFKQNWERIRKNVQYEFAPKDESSVALTKVTFSDGAKKYVYDGSSNASYAIADVNYNFAPLEISDLTVTDLSLPAIGEAPLAQTVTSPGISPKKVEPDRKSVTVGDGVPDVDADIPSGKLKRESTFALIIANENYRRESAVPYASNDGRMLRQYMQKTLGIPEKNIHHIADATLGDMRYEFDWLRSVCDAYGKEASVIVYYAGHGVPDNETLDAYLLPTDGFAERVKTTGFSLAEVHKTLSALPASQTTLLLDACFSGTGREGKMLAQTRGIALKARPLSPEGSLVVISASQGTETAHPYEEKRHGLFTYFLLKKLGESKGEATLGELSDYISSEVRKVSSVNGKPQTPSVSASPANPTWSSRTL